MKATDRRKTGRRSKAAVENSKSDERRASERRSATDRRDDVRVPLELWMEELKGDHVYFRRTGNVSIGGVYFDNALPHEAGTEVTLKFNIPGDREMIVARGRVICPTARQKVGMRVKFISVEGSGKERIRCLIKSL